MTSDKERREVALRLREIKPEKGLHGHVRAEGVFSACGVYSDFGCVRVDELDKLADLIDRPTCEYVPIGDGRFGCSWCGHVVKLDYDVPVADETHMPFNYCPNCSAEVVEDV